MKQVQRELLAAGKRTAQTQGEKGWAVITEVIEHSL